MPDFYPSAKVRLRIRLDEIGTPTSLILPTDLPGGAREPDRTSPEQLVPSATNLRLVEQPVGSGRFVLEGVLTGAIRATIAEGEFSLDNLTHVIGSILPKTANISRNGIRMADTFKMTIPFVDAPFDPRLIRSCGVEIFFGVVTKEDFDRGVRALDARDTGELLSVVNDVGPNNENNRRLIGFADSWEVSWPQDAEGEIMVEGRDLTSLLIDSPLPSGVSADLSLSLTEAIAQVMSTLPSTEGMSVEMRPAGTEPPVLAAAAPRHARSRDGVARQVARGPNDKVSYWDYITDVCGAAGMIVYVDGTAVIIQTPRSAYGTRFVRRDTDTFSGRTVEGEFAPHRRMVYGRDVKSLKAERKFSVKKVNTVQVRCYDTQTKTTLKATFPEDPRVTDAPPGNRGANERVTVFRISGCRDLSTLKRIAQSIYEQQGRNEIAFVVETDDLTSFGGSGEDPDLLGLQAADNLEILVARQADFDTITKIRSLDVSGRVLFLEQLGFSRGLALTYARLFDNAGFQSIFRVRDVVFDWTRDDGMKLTIGCINYITVREEGLLPAGLEPEAPRLRDVSAALNQFEDFSNAPARVRIQRGPRDPDVSPFPSGLDEEF